jgi:hypothetical protein
MAKVFGALHSDAASGMVGDRLTFSRRKTGQQVRFQKAQVVDSASWSQLDNQSLYRAAYDRWICFSAAEKKVYNDKAEAQKLQMSGWNLFLKYAIADPKTYLGLVGYWTFNRPGFGTVLDISKNGNNGTLKPLFPSNCPAFVDSKNKKLGKGLSFDAVDDYVSVGNVNIVTGSPFTISAWIKPKINDYGTILGYDQQHRILLSTSQKRLLSQQDGNFFSDASITIDQWNHIMYWNDGTNEKWYVNGAQSGADHNTVNAEWNQAFLIGQYDLVNYKYWGLIDDVRIYNRALSASEVAQMYKSTK